MTPRPAAPTEILPPVASSSSRPHSPASLSSLTGPPNGNLTTSPAAEELDPFDYQKTVNELTVQFLSEFEETRVAALKWLIMLHQKAPKKVRVRWKIFAGGKACWLWHIDIGHGWWDIPGSLEDLVRQLWRSTWVIAYFSEIMFLIVAQVIKHDLQLLAQISSSSEESYFKAFMVNLLELFSTDRRLLETRGSLIIRQLCLNLNTERIYRTFAEIIEKEDVCIVSLFFIALLMPSFRIWNLLALLCKSWTLFWSHRPNWPTLGNG
jgi:vacuole morphology and inheritance protein 14